jgi:hypothetical protein
MTAAKAAALVKHDDPDVKSTRIIVCMTSVRSEGTVVTYVTLYCYTDEASNGSAEPRRSLVAGKQKRKSEAYMATSSSLCRAPLMPLPSSSPTTKTR